MFLAGLALLSGWLSLASADDIACSATVPCEIGCCGQWGVCGMGPDYCASDVCINNCDAKAECNPGDWADEYVNATTCPLNVCCSKYGFCGTTEEFCGDSTVTRPSCDVDSQSITRVIGYYGSGGASRSCDGIIPSSFPQGVYSHLFFAFGSIDPDTFKVVPASEGDETLYQQLAALKTRDLGLELWLSIGGWTFSDSTSATATTFSDLVNADTTYQNVFFSSLTLFMMTWGFTGVDIDWEYPAADDRSGRESDYDSYPKFLANLKSALKDYDYGLSITLPTSYWYLQHFDLVSIEPSVDWFNYMSYDLHGTWDIGNEWTGAYVGAHTNLTEIETALDLLWRNNITSSKVNMGLAFHGRSVTLASSSCSEPGCSYLSAGDAGECSAQAGILLNSEIEQIISDNNLTPILYEDAAVKTITWNDDQWVSYDDEDTWKIKADFTKSQCLGGVLVWAVDYDDSTNSFSDGLAAALGNELNVDTTTGLTLTVAETSSSTESQGSYCRFVNCGESCPSGFTQVTRNDKKSEIMLDSTECPPGSDQMQVLCCPTSTNVPPCQWRGFHNSGKCNGGCNSEEAEVGTTSSGCGSGYQSACCTITDSTAPWSDCSWTSDCFSDDTCPSGYSNYVTESRDGWGGRPSCSGGKKKNYYCKDSIPDAFTNCAWYGHETTFTNEYYCADTCPSDQIRIAVQSISTLWGDSKTAHSSDCYYGNEAYCCSGATSSGVNPRTTDPFVYQDQTASDFDAYLQKFLASPVCPGGWDAGYSANENLASRNLQYQVLSDILRSRATDESITLTFLLPMISTWITSQYPRADMVEIYNYRLNEYGYGTDGANFTLIEETLYQGSWSTYPVYTPDELAADLLCNIANSENGIDGLDVASQSLCVELDDTSTKKRDEFDH
ncbi:putative chitinase [Seiridium unicorne]|uniref:chitinase n=1 Tax=Seiridium unicorne TaxID=138068 RepID=A0ABR2UU47_9PEZI